MSTDDRTDKELKKEFRGDCIAFIVLLITEMVFLRNLLFTDGMLGDLGDGRFTALISDHWWRVLCGKEKSTQIPIFYPNKASLGYSDLHLVFGLLMIPLRMLGMDLYLSFKWAVIGMHLFGLFSMYFLLRKEYKLSILWSLTGSVSFAHCCALTNISMHPQLFAVCMMPLLLLFFNKFLRHFKDRKKRNRYACVSLTWFMLIVYTSWYIACFTGLFCLIFILLYLLMNRIKYKGWVSWLKEIFSTIGRDIWGYLGLVLVLSIPFLIIYIPALKETGTRGFSDFRLPYLMDMINVSQTNLMMGWFFKAIGYTSRDHEMVEGFSLVLLALFVFVCADLLKKRKKDGKSGISVPALVCITVIICLFLLANWKKEHHSFWVIVYILLPPMRAVRAAPRFLLWLCFPLSVVTAVYADRSGFFREGRRAKWWSLVLFLLMFFSTIDTNGLSVSYLHGDRRDFMEQIAEAPQDMECFYLCDTDPKGRKSFAYQLDAYEVALTVGRPSINGYSGNVPHEWELEDPASEEYGSKVLAWIEKNNLTNVYAYDYSTNSWQKQN